VDEVGPVDLVGVAVSAVSVDAVDEVGAQGDRVCRFAP
jgi:hypothetical protein